MLYGLTWFAGGLFVGSVRFKWLYPYLIEEEEWWSKKLAERS